MKPNDRDGAVPIGDEQEATVTHKRSRTASDRARVMVGDGKLPNHYFVSLIYDWYTNKGAEKNSFNWAGDVYKLPKPTLKQEIFEYNTFREALEKAEDLANECPSPEAVGCNTPHGVMIEDRLTGVLYQGIWLEVWYEKVYRGEILPDVRFHWEWQDDHRYTEETMKKRGVEFE